MEITNLFILSIAVFDRDKICRKIALRFIYAHMLLFNRNVKKSRQKDS